MFAFGAALLSVAAATAQEPSPAFRTGVRVVNVPCTVRDRQGNYVSNLTKDDFTIRDSGVEQKVAYFSAPGNDPLTITLLLDTNSPWLDFLHAEKNAAIQFFGPPLGNSVSASLARFDHDFWVVEDFTDSAKQLLAAAHRLPEHGAEPDPKLEKRLSFKGLAGSGVVQTGRNAQLYEAMYLAANRMRDRQGRKALIVVSDWLDLGTRLGLESVLQAAEDSSTVLFPVRLAGLYGGGPGEAQTNALLRKLAGDTGGRNLDVDADHPLDALLEQIRKELSAQYLLGYTPSGTAGGNGYRRIEVAAREAGLRVRARAGYDSGAGAPQAAEAAEAAEATPTFSATATAPAPPPTPGWALETLQVQTPPRPVCTLFASTGSRTGLLGGMESLLPLVEKDASGPEDAEAAEIVKKVAEKYRNAQSISLTGVWETERKDRFAGREFDRMDTQFLSEQSKINVSLAMERSGAVSLEVDAAWTLMPTPNAEPFASQYRLVTDGISEWMYWPESGVYSKAPASGRARDVFRVVLDRYANPANYPADLRVVRRSTTLQSGGDPLHYVVLRGGGPAAGLTHEFWVEEEHHLVIFEQIRDWAGRDTANLTWKQQSLDVTLARESFVFTPPPGTTQTADRLGLPEPRCGAVLSFVAAPSEVTPVDFTLPDQDGQPVRFAELKGAVMLTFWHTWTPLAAAQLQILEKFQKSHGTGKLTVLGYTDEPPEVVRAYLKKNGLTLRTLVDPKHGVKWLYPRPPGWREIRYTPTTVVVARDRKRATAWPGGLSMEGLEQALQMNK